LKHTLQIFFLAVILNVKAQNVIVLGVAQDAGYPQMGCEKECCNKAWKNDSLKRNVVSLALTIPEEKKWYLFEATPDIKEQLKLFRKLTNSQYDFLPDGIFITHAHIGHYTGLMELGREAMNTKNVYVYVLPKLKSYLETNGPWNQLVKLDNIHLLQLDTLKGFEIEKNVLISAFTVPHRDEYSETAGFRIFIGKKGYLFIPDIDKWQKWNKNVIEEVKKVDVAFLDATFSEVSELPNRKIEEVPHPFISETMELFKNESKETKSKIHFLHFNHTNPVMWDRNTKQKVIKEGFNVAEQGKNY
jgi:pyrroloquinoline quinone biosynthesis protein B